MSDAVHFIGFVLVAHRVALQASIVLAFVVTLGCTDSPSAPSAPPPAAPRLSVTSVVPNTGPTGSAVDVRIIGTGFRTGATVTLDGVTANVVVVSDSTITATVLPHPAGRVDVVVTNPEGDSTRLAEAYTYVPVAITSISPRVGLAGSVVRINGTGFLSEVVVTLGGIPATVGVVTSTSITATVPVNANGAVDVVVTNPGGQSDTMPGGFTYEVNTLTVAPTSIAPGGQLTVSWVVASSQSSPRWGFDWIGLYKLGDPNTSFIWYEYVNGATPGMLTVTAPIQPGQYEFRYLPNDGYTDIARSSVVTVETSPNGSAH